MGLWRQVTDGAGLFYVCIRAIRGKAAGSAACTPLAIFQASFCRQKQTAQGLAREKGEGKIARGEGRQDSWGWITYFLLLHNPIFLKRDICLLCTLRRCKFHASPIYWQQWQDPDHPWTFPPFCAKAFVFPFCIWETSLPEAGGQGWCRVAARWSRGAPQEEPPLALPCLTPTRMDAATPAYGI